MAKKPFTLTAPERPTLIAPTRPGQPIYELSTVAFDTTPSSIALPPEAVALSDHLRELAVRVLGARRRIGEALLDACRWYSEARATAPEGQWYIFLRVTGTSPDSAENLLNIHVRVLQSTAFAERIRSGWLNQTVAGELAKPSTPPELIQQLLAREEPPRVADVKRARRPFLQARDEHHIVDNPNYSGSVPAIGPPHPVDNPNYSGSVPAIGPPHSVDTPNNSGSSVASGPPHLVDTPNNSGSSVASGPPLGGGNETQAVADAEQTTLAERLAAVAVSLEAIAVHMHPVPSDEDTIHALRRIKEATETIRRLLTVA